MAERVGSRTAKVDPPAAWRLLKGRARKQPFGDGSRRLQLAPQHQPLVPFRAYPESGRAFIGFRKGS